MVVQRDIGIVKLYYGQCQKGLHRCLRDIPTPEERVERTDFENYPKLSLCGIEVRLLLGLCKAAGICYGFGFSRLGRTVI